MKPKTRKKTITGYVWPDAVLGYQPDFDHWIEIVGEPVNPGKVRATITFEWEEEKP